MLSGDGVVARSIQLCLGNMVGRVVGQQMRTAQEAEVAAAHGFGGGAMPDLPTIWLSDA